MGADAGYALLVILAGQQTDALGSQRFEIRATRNKRNVLTRQRKPRADISAYCTRTDDRYLH